MRPETARALVVQGLSPPRLANSTIDHATNDCFFGRSTAPVCFDDYRGTGRSTLSLGPSVGSEMVTSSLVRPRVRRPLKTRTSSFALPTFKSSGFTYAFCPSLPRSSGTCFRSPNLTSPPNTTSHTSIFQKRRKRLTFSSDTFTRSPLPRSRTSIEHAARSYERNNEKS